MNLLSMIPLLLLVVAAHPLWAASTATWEMNTYDDFLKGRFDGISLDREGQLRLAPKLEAVFSSEESAIWSVARAHDGTLYLGTGHRGRLYRVSPSGQSEVIWTADQPEIFAVALDSSGRLFAATSPIGQVYRIENGQGTEYFDPGTTYIWTLAFGPGGELYAGTGDGGKVFRITAAGEGEVYYDTGQAHITSLAIDASGRLLAGTEPNGILYRISAKDRAFVLYDANLPEIRALVPMPDGTVYAAALGGSVAKQTAAASTAVARAATPAIAHTSISVTAAQGGVQIKPQAAKPKPTPAAVSASTAPPVVELSGVERSALFRIHPDNTVEKLWTSKTENAYDLLATSSGNVTIATDQKGRLYQLSADGNVTLMVQTNEGEAVRLLPSDHGTLVATGNRGRIYRVDARYTSEGTYEAPVHDAARVARWGRLSWTTFDPGSGQVEFQTRTGNSARPDRTWSEWSAPLTEASGSAVPSPNARYVQWRARIRGAADTTPAIDSVTLSYLPQNAPPKVTGILVTSQASPAAKPASTTATSQTGPTAAYSITVTDTGEPGASTVSGTSTQRLTRSASDKVKITWSTEDLDGDPLIYSLYFRGEGEREWKLIQEDLEDSTYSLDSDSLADGKYLFRVVASDRRANPPEFARDGERTSAPVLLDHTPPVITTSEPSVSGGQATIEFRVEDAASALQRCEYSLDAGEWTPVAAVDGIVDSKTESFRLLIDKTGSRERLVVIRAYDSAQNAGLSKVILR